MALGEHFGDTFLCKYYKEQYNIIRNEPIGIKHIIAIITYTDKTEFCTEFRKTYRKIKNENEHQVTKRHRQLYFYSRSLLESVEFFGEFMSAEMKVFTGLNRVMKFSQFTTYFNQPVSTSTSKTTAHQFSEGKGIILMLNSGTKYLNDPTKRAKYLSVSWLSNFPNENEKLFYGFYVMFQITDIIEAKTFRGHAKELLLFNKFQKTIQNQKVIWNDIKDNKKIQTLVILIKQRNNYIAVNSLKSPYITEFGQSLFNYFCDNPTLTLICIQNFQLLPIALKNALFADDSEKHGNRISLIPISKLFRNTKDLILNELDIQQMTSDAEMYKNAVLDYVNNYSKTQEMKLEKITFKSKQQNDFKQNSTLKKLVNKYFNGFMKHKWTIRYDFLPDNTHNLSFTKNTIHQTTNISTTDKNTWDIVYMTACPLVTYKEMKQRQLELIDVSRESERFMSMLAKSGRRLRIIHKIATITHFIQTMSHGCRILHFVGHAGKTHLGFEDENSIGDCDTISFEKIISDNNFKQNTLQFELIFIATPYAELIGQLFATAGLNHIIVVDTMFQTSSDRIMKFTQSFYDSLLYGGTILNSFNLAKRSAEATSNIKKTTFKLLPENGIHNVVLFKQVIKGNILNETRPKPLNNLPATIKPFVGRAKDMRDIMHSFMTQKNHNCRILNVYGDKGCGKSAVSIMIGRYLNDRKTYFQNGIYYIDTVKCAQNQEFTTVTQMINAVMSTAFEEQKSKMKWNVNNDGDSAELISNLKTFCRYALFIIDDIDQLIAFSRTGDIDINKELFAVLFKILIQVSEKIQIIIISKKICSAIYQYNNKASVLMKTYHLKRLSTDDSCNLFAKLTGRIWRQNDIRENINIMSVLQNNPQRIHNLANLKHEFEIKSLKILVETFKTKQQLAIKKHTKIDTRNQYREQLMKENIKNSSARIIWRKAKGMQTCSYHAIFDILKVEFKEFTSSSRKLQENNLIECFRLLGMNNDLTISVEKFDILYNWFNGLIRLVQALSDYYDKLNPIIIHGFISREEAQNMILENNQIPIGTFIIRFRYKQPK
eukprot:139301_1